jgi:hypothetical protein
MQIYQIVITVAGVLVALVIALIVFWVIAFDLLVHSGVILSRSKTVTELIKERWERSVARYKSRRFKHRKTK